VEQAVLVEERQGQATRLAELRQAVQQQVRRLARPLVQRPAWATSAARALAIAATLPSGLIRVSMRTDPAMELGQHRATTRRLAEVEGIPQ
jgi:hypothetical protein